MLLQGWYFPANTMNQRLIGGIEWMWSLWWSIPSGGRRIPGDHAVEFGYSEQKAFQRPDPDI